MEINIATIYRIQAYHTIFKQSHCKHFMASTERTRAITNKHIYVFYRHNPDIFVISKPKEVA